MTQPPPALTEAPQFSAAYWARAPRRTKVGHIERVGNLPDGWVEIVLKEGPSFRRKRSEIQQLLAPNAEVHIETFQDQIVTGLMVPGVGWAFRMTAQDLADYAKELAVAVHRQQEATREAVVEHLARAITDYFVADGATVDTIDSPEGPIDVVHGIAHTDPSHLARAIISALQQGPA